jgi:(3R)-3-hydroxyacyl-CoA dehydrogenase / 3a,7a,12a-trihydroxy-5b-cholest-24-enoyl-CoA hydratase / enoyl-CoA hydratase 2
MSNELRFDGKVAIVTGAGGGLGRSHALLLAARGAKVVVNDLGGSFTGEGKSASAADKVVAEIKAAGGDAVANYDSVEDGDKIVKTAIDTWGKIDILVNNAGILRDVSFQKMTQPDWDLVYKVHVFGTFKVTHAAWNHMRDAGYGRIINTSSAAGIYGNFGQANYAMAKLGIHGFTQTLAAEGRKRNIIVNTIAPIAGSRMTETVLPKELLEALKPEYVSALVAKLAHEGNEDTGGLYEVGGGFYAKLRWERAAGKTFRLGRAITPEDVDGSWQAITGFDKAEHPGSVAESMQPIMANVEAGPSKGGNQFIDVDAALGFTYPEQAWSYDTRDVSLYALGVGAAKDPTNENDLALVYEMSGKGMRVLPSFGVVPAITMVFDQAKRGITAPGLNFGLDRVLHGEQYTEVVRPLPTSGKLSTKAKVKDIFDKGKNALVVTEFTTYDENGDVLIKNELTTFVRGAGGWGGDRGPSADVNVPPERAPDAVIEDKTSDNQALLYRLSGDWNPLHADPGFAKAFGFQRPILHGLCSFGIATRAVATLAPEGDPRFIKSLKARFASTVLPGETLVTELWKEGNKVIFRTKIKERGEVCISNAAAELWTELPKPKAKAKPAPAGASATAAVPTSADIFRAIGTFVAGNPATQEKVKTTFLFKLNSPDAQWTIDLSSPPGAVHEGAVGKAACTLEISDADFMAMATGQADAMKLFSTGKLKISGDVMASQKLGFLKKLTPEMVLAETRKRTGASTSGAAATNDTSALANYQPTTEDAFDVIQEFLNQNPSVTEKVGVVYGWKVGDKRYLLDLKSVPGKVTAGEGAAECTLELSEEDFLAMTQGKADPMKLFTSGKLKISGNIMASQKLNFLAKMDPSKAIEVIAKKKGLGGGAGGASAQPAAAAAPAKAAEPNAPRFFAALDKRVAENKALVQEVRAQVTFNVTDPAATKKYELGAGTEAILTIADADLPALASGNIRSLYQHGKLRVDGDVSVAHRLGFLKGLL